MATPNLCIIQVAWVDDLGVLPIKVRDLVDGWSLEVVVLAYLLHAFHQTLGPQVDGL